MTGRPVHPKDAEVIARHIRGFLDAGIERFGEAGFIQAVEAYMGERRNRA